jgi:hypothetical protein
MRANLLMKNPPVINKKCAGLAVVESSQMSAVRHLFASTANATRTRAKCSTVTSVRLVSNISFQKTVLTPIANYFAVDPNSTG